MSVLLTVPAGPDVQIYNADLGTPPPISGHIVQDSGADLLAFGFTHDLPIGHPENPGGTPPQWTTCRALVGGGNVTFTKQQWHGQSGTYDTADTLRLHALGSVYVRAELYTQAAWGGGDEPDNAPTAVSNAVLLHSVQTPRSKAAVPDEGVRAVLPDGPARVVQDEGANTGTVAEGSASAVVDEGSKEATDLGD